MSGIGWGGAPRAVVDAALDGKFEWVTSPALLQELERVVAWDDDLLTIGVVDRIAIMDARRFLALHLA